MLLRKAFKATLEDREFLAEAKKSQLDIDYVSAEEVERHIEETRAMPTKAKANLAFLVRKGKQG